MLKLLNAPFTNIFSEINKMEVAPLLGIYSLPHNGRSLFTHAVTREVLEQYQGTDKKVIFIEGELPQDVLRTNLNWDKYRSNLIPVFNYPDDPQATQQGVLDILKTQMALFDVGLVVIDSPNLFPTEIMDEAMEDLTFPSDLTELCNYKGIPVVFTAPLPPRVLEDRKVGEDYVTNWKIDHESMNGFGAFRETPTYYRFIALEIIYGRENHNRSMRADTRSGTTLQDIEVFRREEDDD